LLSKTSEILNEHFDLKNLVEFRYDEFDGKDCEITRLLYASIEETVHPPSAERAKYATGLVQLEYNLIH